MPAQIALHKTVRLGTVRTYIGDTSVFCKIDFDGCRLSIIGVEGPKLNGDAVGSCGQIVMHLLGHEKIITPAPGWTHAMIAQFLTVWDRWHLNDMRAGSPAQHAWLESNPIDPKDCAYPESHYDVASARLAAAGLNPDPNFNGGYRYGSGWLSEEVPAEVIDWLRGLPDTDAQPAWV
jgi:hypothetical protein